jgi:hypothetical protein
MAPCLTFKNCRHLFFFIIIFHYFEFIKLIEDPSCYCSGCTSLNHSGKGAASKFTICCVPGEKCMCCEKFDASYEKYRTGVIDTENKDHAKYVTLNNALFVMFPKNFVKKTAKAAKKAT